MCVVKVHSHTIDLVSYLICFCFFCFTSIRSQFLRYSYFEIWPSKIQNQRHGWGQRSRSHSWPRIQPMHLLFVSRHRINHSWDLSNSVWPSKNTTAILKKKNNQKILFNRIPPKCNQVMSITWGDMAKNLYWLDEWLLLYRADKQIFVNQSYSCDLDSRSRKKVIQYIFPNLYLLCPKYVRLSSNRFMLRSKSCCCGVSGRGNKLKT